MCTESQEKTREDAAKILEEIMFLQFFNFHGNCKSTNPNYLIKVNQGKHTHTKLPEQFIFKMRQSSHKRKIIKSAREETNHLQRKKCKNYYLIFRNSAKVKKIKYL